MKKVSFLDCKHNDVQQFTEMCLICGYNVYTSKEEYLVDLRQIAAREAAKTKDILLTQQIRELEKALGYTHDNQK